MFPIRMNYYGFWYRRRSSGRLKTILSQPERRQKVLEKLYNLSKDIDDNLEGINYPDFYKNRGEKQNIDYSDIDADELKSNILFFIPKLEMSEQNSKYLELVKMLYDDLENIYIITTEECDYELRQKFEEYATVYDLTSFISIDYWTDFINYFKEKKGIKKIISTENNYFDYFFDRQNCNDEILIKLNSNEYFYDYDHIIESSEIQDIYSLIKELKKQKTSTPGNKNSSFVNLFLDYRQLKNDIIEKEQQFNIELENIKKENDEILLKRENEYEKNIKDIENNKELIIEQKDYELIKIKELLEKKEKELASIYSGKTWKIASNMSKIVNRLRKK